MNHATDTSHERLRNLSKKRTRNVYSEVRNGAPKRLVGAMNDLTVRTERDAWFTPDSLAAYLQVSDRMIRKWVAEGRLISYKLDGCRRFDPVDVDDFVSALRDERAVVA